MALLDDTARQRIATTIGEIEQRTAGEIVVVDVPASDSYQDVRLLYATSLGLAVAALMHGLSPTLSVTLLLCLQLATIAVTFVALGWGPLLRRLAPRTRLAEATQRRARDEFLEHALFATRDRSGILILLSELEHRVVILGDAGIHSHVQTQGWQQHVDHIIASIAAGKPGEGVCEVVRALGEVLARQLPARADDRNELSNEVR
jgi:putative membrane protein